MNLSHDMFSRILPHVHSWVDKYGKRIFQSDLVNFNQFSHFKFCFLLFFGTGNNYLQWFGPKAQLVVTEPELIKEIMNNRDNAYSKSDNGNYAKKLLGDGLVTSEGEKWAKMRKLANYAFHAESLKVISYS